MTTTGTHGASLAAFSLILTTLAGCGGGPVIPTEKFVYVSATDCIDAKRLTADQCSHGVEQAVQDHDEKSAKYVTIVDCEFKHGIDRCERFAERHYRPRLMGYLFVVNKTVVASALYGDLKKPSIFLDNGGAAYDFQRTQGVTFSQEAATKARNLKAPKLLRKT